MDHGKSTLACILCKEFAKLKKKTLLIDFDVFNSSINLMYKVLKYNKNAKAFDLKENIIEVTEYEHLLCSTDTIFSDENTIEYINIEKILEEFRGKYDQIIIDTTSNFKYKYLNKILELADDVIFTVVPSITELKKAINLYEIFREDFQIPFEKIKLVINKESKYSVDDVIVQKMFGVKKLSGKMKYNEKIEGGKYECRTCNITKQ